MRCPAKGSPTPPDRGWLVYTNAKGWIPDGTMRVSTAPYTWCPHLTVSATGAAAREQAKCLGRYQATSITSCGSKVRDQNHTLHLIQ